MLRFEPFRELDRITEEMLTERRVRPVAVDAYRRGNEFKVLLDLPGADPGSIDLTVEKDVLTVRATRTPLTAEGDEIQVAERGHGKFSRPPVHRGDRSTSRIRSTTDSREEGEMSTHRSSMKAGPPG